jgi:hypothetical protein
VPPVPGAWSVSLHSTFFYDYSSIVQNTPYLLTNYSIFPAGVSDKSAWNSYWSPTVMFADGTFNSTWNIPWPNAVVTGKHVWIQEDAWGNCAFFSN